MLTRSHPIPAAYRRPRIEALDARLRRCLAIAGAPAALLLLLVAILPARQAEIVSVEELPERFAKLILEEATSPPPAAEVSGPKTDTPEQVVEEAAPPTPPQPKTKTTPRVRRERAPKVTENQGQKGRDRATKEVTAQVTKVTRELDRSLAAITSSLDQSVSAQDDRPQRRRGRATRRGRRKGAAVTARSTSSTAESSGGDALSVAAIDLGSIASEGEGSAGGRGGDPSADDALGGGSTRLGERSQSSLLQVVRRYAPGIRYCYDHALKSSPDLRGKMAFRLRILPDGSVSEVSVIEDTLRDSGVRECALAQIQDWSFPAAAGATVFETPFVFRPRR